MALLSDDMLVLASRLPLVRRAVARKAAGRAMHALALATAPDDPVVLARLDLLEAAATAPPRDRAGHAARDYAVAALGGGELGAGGRPWQRRLTAEMARTDPAAAAQRVMLDSLAAAACWLAAGSPEQAAACVEGHGGPESILVRAAIRVAREQFADARQELNALFAAFGLAPPLSADHAPFRVDDFAGPAIAPVDGRLVSMVMPLFNNAASVEHAIQSLRCQSWRNLEVLVCDDGSSDDGAARVARLAREDRRVRLVRNDRTPGAAGARNRALIEARGAFIGFLDADDWAHPQRVARQVAAIGRGAGAVSRHFRMDEHGLPVAPRVFPLLRLCPISMIVRADALAQAGPFDQERAGTDAEMLARLDVMFGRRAMVRDRAPLTVARWRPRSISNDPERGLFEAERRAYRARWMRAHARLWQAGGLPIALPPS